MVIRFQGALLNIKLSSFNRTRPSRRRRICPRRRRPRTTMTTKKRRRKRRRWPTKTAPPTARTSSKSDLYIQ